MDGGQLKNVCLSVCLSVCCLLAVCDEFIPNYLLNRWYDWAKMFFLQKLEKMFILILKFRG